MYTVTIESDFKAQHQLKFFDGSTEPLHDHDWHVRLAVSAHGLDKNGLAVDFNDIKSILQDVTAPINGIKLEDFPHFAQKQINASAEYVAKYIYDTVKLEIADGLVLEYVEVMEEPGCWAKYELG